MEPFFLTSVPKFAILSCENATAAFAGRTWNPPIHRGLAEAILNELVARDFDMAYSQEADLDHSFAAIFEWVLEGRAIPVVPIFINTYLLALPSAHRCAALGKAIHELQNSHSDSFINLRAQQLDEVGNTEMLPRATVLSAVGPQQTELRRRDLPSRREAQCQSAAAVHVP
jgi:hypothetical protein